VLGCPPPGAVGGVADRVLAALTRELQVGEIAEAVSLPIQELLPCLMEMELANLVEKMPGNYYKKLSAPGS
jgi:predicted Rossmann fold nucleotide-binding protein DprA/Smf involved in DNA uptake